MLLLPLKLSALAPCILSILALQYLHWHNYYDKYSLQYGRHYYWVLPLWLRINHFPLPLMNIFRAFAVHQIPAWQIVLSTAAASTH